MYVQYEQLVFDLVLQYIKFGLGLISSYCTRYRLCKVCIVTGIVFFNANI